MKTLEEIIKNRSEKIFEKEKEHQASNKTTGYIGNLGEIQEKMTTKIYKNVPPRYKDAEIITDDYKNIPELLRESKGIYFHGTAGTGKTYLLYAICKRLRANGYDCDVWNFPDELSKIRSMYSTKGEGEEAVDEYLKQGQTGMSAKYWQRKPIIILDDVGAEKPTEWNLEILYRFINYRYEQMLPTFFASNLSLQELAEKTSDRIASRIAEMCEIKEISGDDKRLKMKGEDIHAELKARNN